ncbi:magnesium and cobalt transport protein CorA [Demequina globuliformis]|uniref:magnesium and cobalt transport protein CorA n=1 Tax=Demequina globuliformis TaxID=676202 RepID=UPI000784CDA7|nr:magnesium and cobalt transport protein CorA [Demequina globuliformis]
MSSAEAPSRRSRLGVKRSRRSNTPATSGTAPERHEIRYLTGGVLAPPSHDASPSDALAFAHTSDDTMAVLLYPEPSAQAIDDLADGWDLHPVLVEDLHHGQQRPKLERYGDVLFIVARSAWYVDTSETVEFAEFHLVLHGDALAIICQDSAWIDGSAVAAGDRLSGDGAHTRGPHLLDNPDLLALGPEAIAYRFLDVLIDGYRPVLDGLAIDKDQIERQVFSGDAAATERIYRLNQEIIDLQQACGALTSVITRLTAGFQKYGIAEDLQSYLGDLTDHLTHVNAEVAELRESLTQILTVNATLVGQRQNEDMKKISGWAAILFAPTLIAAIYGMNFDSMPELHWAFGYPLALGSMVAFAVVLYTVFKWKKWM